MHPSIQLSTTLRPIFSHALLEGGRRGAQASGHVQLLSGHVVLRRFASGGLALLVSEV